MTADAPAAEAAGAPAARRADTEDVEALHARVVALACWADQEAVRAAVAARLQRGGRVTAADVVADLEATAATAGGVADAAAVRAARRALVDCGARVVVVGEPGYPRRLADAWPELGAPLWLFVRGPLGACERRPAVAVVGTRRPTLDGVRTARALGRLLAEHGVVVVSGLARGIDQAAHRGALDVDGATVAVLGTGFGVDYPRGAETLRAAIAAAGGLVTEHLPGTPPRPHRFLWRNRIVAGLADATVVVEGRARSGALQTARLAAAQGREVLAVPGSLHAPTSQAPLALIRDGATPVTRLEDVLEAVDAGGGATAAAAAPPPPEALAPGPARSLLDHLGTVPAAPGALAAATGLTVPQVLAALADLESRGLAVLTPRGAVRGDAPR